MRIQGWSKRKRFLYEMGEPPQTLAAPFHPTYHINWVSLLSPDDVDDVSLSGPISIFWLWVSFAYCYITVLYMDHLGHRYNFYLKLSSLDSRCTLSKWNLTIIIIIFNFVNFLFFSNKSLHVKKKKK